VPLAAAAPIRNSARRPGLTPHHRALVSPRQPDDTPAESVERG